MQEAIAKPKFVYSAKGLAAIASDKLEQWEPEQSPIMWMTTNVNLAQVHAYDKREDHFDCLVQFRVMSLDRLRFHQMGAGQLLLPHTTIETKRTSFLEAARRLSGTDDPDDGASLGRIVNVDALYHDSWVAFPYLWDCVKEAVLGDETWRGLLEKTTVDDVLKGRTLLVPAKNVTSQRISFYHTAHHCSWRVGNINFFVPHMKRIHSPMLDITRLPNGWDESVRPFDLPFIQGVTVDPPRRLRGQALDSGGAREDATLEIRREMMERGIVQQ